MVFNVLNGAKHFAEDGSQNHFVFEPLYRCFTALANNTVSGGNLNDFQTILYY